MKASILLGLALCGIAATSCQRHTIIYREKPTVVKRTYSTPSRTPTKTIPGTPIRLGDSTPGGMSTTY